MLSFSNVMDVLYDLLVSDSTAAVGFTLTTGIAMLWTERERNRIGCILETTLYP